MSNNPPVFAPDMIEAFARGLFPEDVAVAISFPWEAPEGLLPEETQSLARPNDKRLREFAAGRRAAHKAMRALRVPVRPVPQGPDRAPLWPEGIVGSLSHNETTCIAVLGHADRYAALALDIEEEADLPGDVLPEICTQVELAWLSVQPEEWRGQLARLIFSAKECAYKLQYPVTGQVLDFSAFEITPDLETGQFEATLTRAAGPLPAWRQFAGRFAVGAGLMLTGMTLPRPSLP